MLAAKGSVTPSRHKCLIYDGDASEQLPVVVPMLADGLRENWRCMYLGSPSAIDMVGFALGTRGIDVSREIDRNALVFSSDRSHLVDGTFDPDAMIDGLCSGIEAAVHDGFEGLCATGDMRWELGDDRNFDRLLEYEARLEQVFRDRPLRGICQYHRDLLPARAINDALVTHRSAYVGDALSTDNMFYMPPELLLESRDKAVQARRGEWMYEQIVRVLDAEQARDHALAVLLKSEAEQRRLAAQLAELNRGLEARVAERTAELRVANRHLEAFSYAVAHDLRTPLRAIKSFTNMLVEDASEALDQHCRGHLQRVVNASDRMSQLIDALLDLSRLSRIELVRSVVDLSAIATSIVDDLHTHDPARDVDVSIAAELRANGDARLIHAALDNLLANAWKFTCKRAHARIEFGVRQDGAERVFFVRDNGMGFDASHAANLFQPFQRLHGTDVPGTGVGLATVQRIVERHHGRIWADGDVDRGATFFFTLPD
jgi:signal transduction histidine kinase